MSLFSKLKDKIVGRREEEQDFETVRSAILGEYAPPVNQQQKMEIQKPDWRTKYSENTVPKEFAEPSLEPIEEKHDLDIRQPYAQSFGQRTEEDKHRWERRDFYELFDRLGIIEAQLAAIRSQTETINERLKMLEIRITRRY